MVEYSFQRNISEFLHRFWKYNFTHSSLDYSLRLTYGLIYDDFRSCYINVVNDKKEVVSKIRISNHLPKETKLGNWYFWLHEDNTLKDIFEMVDTLLEEEFGFKKDRHARCSKCIYKNNKKKENKDDRV